MHRRTVVPLLLALLLIAPARGGADDPPKDAADAKAEYEARKAKLANTAAAHWTLGLWCEKSGLPEQAKEQFAAVVILDPKRDAAWRRLGYRKMDGRWLTEAQIADVDEAKRAIRQWGKTLAAIHKALHSGPRVEEARAALAKITDERALPALWHELGRDARDQEILVQALGQIPGASSSRLLAFLGIYGGSNEVRTRAIETLRGRDPKEYAEDLVALLNDPIKYEVRHVGRPNAPGILFVEGERFNVRRIYQAPAPSVGFQPGDTISYGPDGSPMLVRPIGVGSHLVGKLGGGLYIRSQAAVTFSGSQMALESRNAGIAAQNQLQDDIRAIERANDDTNSFNRLVVNALKDATGKDPGSDRKSWRDWLATVGGYQSRTEVPKPTLNVNVDSGYTPVAFAELTFIRFVSTDA